MNQYIIPGILFSLTLFFGYMFLTGPVGNSQRPVPKENEGRVSYNRLRNLKEQTRVRLDLKKQQAQLARTGEKPVLDPNADKRNSRHELDLNEDYGPAAHDIDARQSASAMTLDQTMDEFLAKKEQMREMEEIQREEFVRRFIEEARRMGYEIEINDDMEIIRAKKIGQQ